MSEIEQYLEQVRSSLDVNTARADESIAEARSHLEARVSECEAKGLSRRQAVAEAVRGFGEPTEVAAALAKANAKHRDASRFRLLLALGLAFGTTLSAVWCFGFLLTRAPASIQAALHGRSIISVPALALPGAVLAGIVAGRRHWWLAATPPLFFMAACWAASLVEWALVPYGDRQLVAALAWPLLSAGAFGACGYLGARVAEARRLRYPIGVPLAAYVLLISVPAFAQAVSNFRDLVLTIAIAQGAACVVLLAAYQERLVTQRVLIVAGTGMTALVGAMGVMVLSGMWGLGGLSGEGRIAFIVSLAVVAYLPAALVWRGMRERRKVGGEPRPGGRHV